MSKLLWIIRVCQVTFVRFFWHALLIKYFLPSMCTAKAGPWTIAPGKHPPFITWKVMQISGVTQRPSIGRTDGLNKRSSNTSQISTSLSGLCSYLRSHFALRLPWFWYLWKETHGPSVLPGKEPPGFWTWTAFCSYKVQWGAGTSC